MFLTRFETGLHEEALALCEEAQSLCLACGFQSVSNIITVSAACSHTLERSNQFL